VHGYWVLFIATFLEGETVLVVAGFLAFEGYLNLGGVIFVTLCGAFLGDQFYFYLGRLKGPFVIRVFSSVARKIRKGLRLIEKYGNLVAIISRYTYGFRIVLPIILGMSSFPARRFLWLNLISALIWAIVFSCAGYIFGKSASVLLEDTHKYEPYLILALFALFACMWLLHFIYLWHKKKPARARLHRMRERVRRD